MDGGIGDILRGGLVALLAMLPVLALLRLGSAAFGLIAPRDAEAVPLLHVIALVTGLALGIALLATVPDPRIFLPSRIFIEQGPWTIGLAEFLGRYALPRIGNLPELLVTMGSLDGLGAVAAWLAFIGLLEGAATALRLWRGAARLHAFAAFLLLAACSAALLHYGVHLLAWLAAQLSFWLFAVVLLMFQRWRYGVRSAH